MIGRSKSTMRQALAESLSSREVRIERLGRAETIGYTGALAASGSVRAAKVKTLYDAAGGAYTDFATDGFIAFLKCKPWSIAASAEGDRDLWIACRKDGWFGLLASGDDADYGVAADDVIAYVPAALRIAVPGQADTYFHGFLDPVLSSHLCGINECARVVD
jgi:hypothetical protein